MTHVTKKCDARDASFFGIISSKLHFFQKYWYSVVDRSFVNANNVLPF